MRRSSLRFAFGCLLGACLVTSFGCQRGPDEDGLRDALQRELDVAFDDGLFGIDTFRRMGSATFLGEGDAPSGLHVYYDAVLEFQRDYALTAWKGLNAGTLAFVVGATDAGISGIRGRGNTAGDLLRVHGRLSFTKVDGAWSPVDVAAPPVPLTAEADRGRQARGSGPKRVLEGVRTTVAENARREQGPRETVIVRELRSALSRIDLQLAHQDGQLTLGAGPQSGTYYRFGEALSGFAKESGLTLHSYESEGSIENGALLRAGLLDFSLVQSDVAETLHLGLTENGILPNRNLRSVASLWPEAVHLVTLESTGIESVGDLTKRRVGVGRRGSGTRFNVLAIALTANMTGSAQPEILDMDVTEGIRALESGAVDAFFFTSAIPSPTLQALAARRPDVRFVSLDAGVVHRLAQERFAYYVLEVDARTYPNQTKPFLTVGLTASLVTSAHVADTSVTQVLELLVDQADTLSGRDFRVGFIARETMRLGLAVPLHRAADRFYRDREAKARAPSPPPAPESDGADAPESEASPEHGEAVERS